MKKIKVKTLRDILFNVDITILIIHVFLPPYKRRTKKKIMTKQWGGERKKRKLFLVYFPFAFKNYLGKSNLPPCTTRKILYTRIFFSAAPRQKTFDRRHRRRRAPSVGRAKRTEGKERRGVFSGSL